MATKNIFVMKTSSGKRLFRSGLKTKSPKYQWIYKRGHHVSNKETMNWEEQKEKYFFNIKNLNVKNLWFNEFMSFFIFIRLTKTLCIIGM